jgi:hypothetical protein
MLKDRILAIITASPDGISAARLRQQFPHVDRQKIKVTVAALLTARVIERCGYGCYAVKRPPSVDTDRTVRGQKLQRLMAGR